MNIKLGIISLEYGKALKQKQAQERVDKLKAEDEECTFKPKIKKKNANLYSIEFSATVLPKNTGFIGFENREVDNKHAEGIFLLF